MSGGYLNNAGAFLIQTLFGLYILALMLRFLLQWVRADFYNPIVQVLVRITNPPLLPLRRLVPGLYGLDMAAVLLMLVLQVVELLLTLNLGGASPGLAGIVILAIAKLLNLLISVFFWAILIVAVLSWINPRQRHPAVDLVQQLVEPVLAPARRILPVMGGLDLSPILVLITLQVARMIIVQPLQDAGLRSLLAY